MLVQWKTILYRKYSSMKQTRLFLLQDHYSHSCPSPQAHWVSLCLVRSVLESLLTPANPDTLATNFLFSYVSQGWLLLLTIKNSDTITDSQVSPSAPPLELTKPVQRTMLLRDHPSVINQELHHASSVIRMFCLCISCLPIPFSIYLMCEIVL